jgi:hypothetical protein
MHGEIGQTQFLPKNILACGTGNLDVAANALARRRRDRKRWRLRQQRCLEVAPRPAMLN